MVKLLVADDHPIIRKGLLQIIQSEGRFEATEVKSGEEVLCKLAEHPFDMLLLDINLPGINGVEVLKRVKQSHPQMPVLMLSIYPEDQYAVRTLKAGASGYLSKESAPEELINAIRKILNGEKYISQNVANQMAFQLDTTQKKQEHDQLSDRELDVMCRIAKGHALTRIADEMNLSVKTISTYRARVLEKMNFEKNAEMTAYAIKHNLINLA
jgi:two-component system invasion response regulator UvrY